MRGELEPFVGRAQSLFVSATGEAGFCEDAVEVGHELARARVGCPQRVAEKRESLITPADLDERPALENRRPRENQPEAVLSRHGRSLRRPGASVASGSRLAWCTVDAKKSVCASVNGCSNSRASADGRFADTHGFVDCAEQHERARPEVHGTDAGVVIAVGGRQRRVRLDGVQRAALCRVAQRFVKMAEREGGRPARVGRLKHMSGIERSRRVAAKRRRQIARSRVRHPGPTETTRVPRATETGAASPALDTDRARAGSGSRFRRSPSRAPPSGGCRARSAIRSRALPVRPRTGSSVRSARARRSCCSAIR